MNLTRVIKNYRNKFLKKKNNKFLFLLHQKITTQILQSKTYKNVLYNKHKIKNLKVKIKANKNDNKNNKIKN